MNPATTHPIPQRIAHAGGGFERRIYNNSEAAVRHNLQEGFEWFEIDFVFGEDGNLWTEADRAALITGDTSASYYSAKDEGSASTDKIAGTERMSLQDLSRLMTEFPQICIVPDVKDVERNPEAMALLLAALPGATERVLPQIFQPEEYLTVRQMGFLHIIWTLYNYAGEDKDVLREAQQMDLAAVTMPIARAEAGLAHRVQQSCALPSLAHTVNDLGQLHGLQSEWGVAEVYSDFLAPGAKSAPKATRDSD